jgi:putative inorganic carbon (HCO3(-)) transporter
MLVNLFEPLGLFIFLVVSAIGAVLAVSRSSWFVDYAFLVIAFNRCIRRMVDYHNGEFNPYSLISLTPLVVCGFATLMVVGTIIRSSSFAEAKLRETLLPYAIAVAFAFVVGLFNARLGAVYSLGDYLAPIGLLAFGSWFSHDQRICDRWCRNFCLIVFIVAVYGLWQFYTIPPWDAFWLLAVDFDGYMGEPEPTKMTLFSTLQERGPAGMFMAGGVILLMLRGAFSHLFRWPMAAVIGYAMLLTYTRTSVILCVAACLLFPLLNRNASLRVILGSVVFLAAFIPVIVQQLPGSEHAIQRVSTLARIQDDSSFQGRLRSFRESLSKAVFEPLGLGLGSHGLAGKVSSATESGAGDSTGYVQTLRTFGWIGTILVVITLVRLWRNSNTALLQGSGDSTVSFYRAWFSAGMVVFYSGDWLFTATFFWVLGGYVIGRVSNADYEEIEHDWDGEMSAGDGASLQGFILQPASKGYSAY